MTIEPYRWLDAIANRREYVEDRLKGATPVFAVSRPEGIFLFGLGAGNSKLFEIYDRHALCVLGNPVDIERLRQTAIESAHTEGFQRAPQDVSMNRLVKFALGPTLKDSFEQIQSPPLIVESIFAELGNSMEADKLARLHFDGRLSEQQGGVSVAFTDEAKEQEAEDWLAEQLKGKRSSLSDLSATLLGLWNALVNDRPLSEASASSTPEPSRHPLRVEAALLDRQSRAEARYRTFDPSDLGLQA